MHERVLSTLCHFACNRVLRAHLWLGGCCCCGTPKHRDCLHFSIMRYDEDDGIFHIDQWERWFGLVVITVVLLPPGHQSHSVISLFIQRGHMVVFTLKQTDWIALFTKQGSDTPVFALNLSLTPCCPFGILLCRMPFLVSFFTVQSEVGRFPSFTMQSAQRQDS